MFASMMGCACLKEEEGPKEVQVVTAVSSMRPGVLAEEESSAGQLLEVELLRSFPGEPVGLHLSLVGDTIVVKSFDQDCLFGIYNKNVPADRKVLPGAIIQDVNGFRDLPSIEACLKQDMELRLEVLREVETMEEPVHFGRFGTTVAPPPSWKQRAGGSADFEVQLERESRSSGLGVHVVPLAEVARVITVDRDGLLADYNFGADEDKDVRKNDLIVSVNGHTDLQSMGPSLQEDLSLTLKVLRPTEFTVNIDRQGQSLGVSFTTLVSSFNLVVAEIGSGAVLHRNKSGPEAAQVKVGDIVIAVNGSTGRSAELLNMVQSCDWVQLQLLRHPDLA